MESLTKPLVSIPWNNPLALSAMRNAAIVAVSAVLLLALTSSLSSMAWVIFLSIKSNLSISWVLTDLNDFLILLIGSEVKSIILAPNDFLGSV